MDLSHIENFHRILDNTSAEIRRMIARKQAEIAQLEDLDRQLLYTRSINPPKPLAQVLQAVAPIFQDQPAASADDENDPLAEAVTRAVGATVSMLPGAAYTEARPADQDDDEHPVGVVDDVRSIARRFAPAGQ
jgi:hypothetical protein